MGAWDHTTFGNDDACDWGGDLRSCEDLLFVEETLEEAVRMANSHLAPKVTKAPGFQTAPPRCSPGSEHHWPKLCALS